MALFKKKNKRVVQDTRGDKVQHFFTTCVLILVILVVGYPILYVISSSLSDSASLSSGRVTIFPLVFDSAASQYKFGVDLSGYKFVLSYDMVVRGFLNSLLYTVLGTAISLVMIILMAYPISKPNFQGRKPISKLLVFAMLVSAGLVPHYLLMTSLGLNEIGRASCRERV